MMIRMFLFLSLMIQPGENLEIAEANIHFDANGTSIGILTLLQRDANHPVRVVGVLRGLASNTVHVRRTNIMPF